MTGLTATKEISYNVNLVQNKTFIYVGRKNVSTGIGVNWKVKHPIYWSQYQIKETDFRIKTATFSSPNYFDLTTGVFCVLITSPYHEDFGGIILSVTYNEDTGLYDYQCQDWSRQYMNKIEIILQKVLFYRLLQYLVTGGAIPPVKKVPKSLLKAYKFELSGLRKISDYDRKKCGGIIKGNPMLEEKSIIVRDKSFIETIRDLVIGSGEYIDVYFNKYGVLQLEPYHKNDFFNTGLHLTTREVANRKFKFDTTNIITHVTINGEDLRMGVGVRSQALTGGVDLSAYFGNLGSSISDPLKSETTSNNSKTTGSSSVKSTTPKTKTNTNNNGNPYGNKAKKVWIGADGGSGSFAREIASLLAKNGWTAHYSGEGAAVHNNDYKNVTSDYQILAIVDNGFCCTTVKEAYEGYAAPILRNKGVTVMFMFDTRNWTSGMAPYRYGDFSGYVAHTAWDDSSGYCTTMNVDNFFRNHNAVYCANPTASGMVQQFLAGGYYKFKGK